MDIFQSQGQNTKVKGQWCLNIYVAYPYEVMKYYLHFKKLELIQAAKLHKPLHGQGQSTKVKDQRCYLQNLMWQDQLGPIVHDHIVN